MKNEKLKLLLNKVVEYNDPKANDGKGCHFKAFLYKNNDGYYFKIVEIIVGANLAFNDLIDLKKGDENLLIVADTPKLMRVSKYSWHYKLLKYIMRNNAPTPKDMQNGCPYFWLLIFSMLVLPFKLIYMAVAWIILLIPKLLFWILEGIVESWIAGLEDEDAYDIYQGYNSKMPKTARIFFNDSDNKFFNFFLSNKYKDLNDDDPDYKKKREEIKNKWEVWYDDIEEKRNAQRAEEDKKEIAIQIKRNEYNKKRAISKAKWNVRMQPIRDGFKKFGISLKKTFTVERGRVNLIVKRTKQFMGAIVTLGILISTFIAVNFIALGLMVIIDWCITNWLVFVVLGLFGIGIGILYLLYILISSWGEAIFNKYRRGKKVWYIEPFIYLVWYPIKYIALGIAFFVVNIILIPINFIFITALFKFILKPIGIFIGKLFVSIVKGIGSSSGIFGEYFGASYSDYCPGIEWCDFDEEENQ